MKKHYDKIFIFIFPSIILLTALFGLSFSDLAQGMQNIITSPSMLLTDYLSVGGVHATLLNVALCGYISCFLVILLKIEINGPFIAAIYTVMGFAFFGKNIVNIWPIFIGIGLYAKVQKVPYKNYALVALFGTTLAPLVSFMAFASGLSYMFSLPLALGIGIFIGFILPPLASHMLRFHDGFNIYNIGFTGGIVGSFLTAILRSFGFDIAPFSILSTEHHLFFTIYFFAFFLFLIAYGLVFGRIHEKGQLLDNLKKIHKSTGRLISDFTLIGSLNSSIINMGIMGILSLGFVLFVGAQLNGPIIGGILTVVGFAAFGKHAKNCIPILLGIYLASFLKIWGSSANVIAISGLFGTTLAPIAGQYGFFAGVLAGFCHLSIVNNVGRLHGGVNLYNNGFAGGFVASFLVPIFDALKKDDIVTKN